MQPTISARASGAKKISSGGYAGGRSDMRGAAISTTRLITADPVRREPVRERSVRAAPATGGTDLSVRAASSGDIPWVQAWTAHLGLPAAESRRIRSFILLRGSQRVGYFAVREDMTEATGVREPILWIVAAFLIPSLRGQGLLVRFGEILSRQYYRQGKVGCRIAADNTRMRRLLARGGWNRVHETSRYVDYQMEMTAPFTAHRR
jgi:hypothetical protein